MYAMRNLSDIDDLIRDVFVGTALGTGPFNVAKVWMGARSPGGYHTPYKWTSDGSNAVLDTSSSAWVSSPWASNEPNYLMGVQTGPDVGGEQCIAMQTTSTSLPWMDYYCSAKLPGLMEIPNVEIDYKFGPWPSVCPSSNSVPCGSITRAYRERSCILIDFHTGNSWKNLTIPDAHCERLIDTTPQLMNRHAAVRACTACSTVPTDDQINSSSVNIPPCFMLVLLCVISYLSI
jgi:hypothetical protein